MSNCSKCKSKLIPVGFNPELGKTVDRLYCVDLDFVCIDCLIAGLKRAEAAEARIKELEHDIEVDDWHAAFVQAEAERDESSRQLSEAQRAIDVLSQTIVAQDATIKRLEQAREDVADYRAEIERLTQKAMTA